MRQQWVEGYRDLSGRGLGKDEGSAEPADYRPRAGHAVEKGASTPPIGAKSRWAAAYPARTALFIPLRAGT
jgi:hypothetical protein